MSPTAPADVSPDTLEQYRRELTGYCYRMLGSGFEADDAVQETMLRAWRAADGFEGRSSVRSGCTGSPPTSAWTCCAAGSGGRCRSTSGEASPPVEALLGGWHPDDIWISPIADAKVVPEHGDPADIAVARDTIRLAFVTALQHLPARQRATLILCEVLKMPAAEAAATLGTSVAAVNSALQRARATLAALPEEQRPASSTRTRASCSSHRRLSCARPLSVRRGVQALAGRPIDLAGDMALTLRDWTLWTRPGQRWPNWCRFLERLSGCVVAAAQIPSSPPAQTQQAPATAPGNSAAGIASLSGLPSRDTYCKPIGRHWGKCFLVLGCQHPARDASRARTQETVRSNHGTVSSPLQRGARQSWPSACVRTCRSPQATGRRDSCYIIPTGR